MRMRQGPLIEASIVYVVSSLLSFIVFIATSGGNISGAFGIVSVEAILLLLPSFVLWAIVGFLTRTKSVPTRFFSQVTVSAAVVAFGIFLINGVAQAKGSTISPEQLLATWYVISATYFITSLLGSIFTNFWFVRKAQAAAAFESKNMIGKK